MKVIKEKAANTKEAKIKVICNSTLAETLMNDKHIEIYQLEEEHKCKVIFNFDNHYSSFINTFVNLNVNHLTS